MAGNGINGDYTLQVLKTTGKPLAQYQWVHRYSKGAWQDGYWKVGSKKVSESDDVLFRPGQGFWFILNKRYNIQNAALVNNGNAVIDSYTLSVTNGNQVVGVPTSFAVPISKIIPSGYLENAAAMAGNGINGDFTMQVLKTTGKPLAQYQWVHRYSKGAWQDGYWKNGSKKISSTNEEYLPAGSAVWFILNKRYNIEGANIVLPGIDEL